MIKMILFLMFLKAAENKYSAILHQIQTGQISMEQGFIMIYDQFDLPNQPADFQEQVVQFKIWAEEQLKNQKGAKPNM